MVRFMCCGIATKISINSKVSIKENKEDILNRIKCVFDLKYYDIVEDDSDKHICLYLKEDIFNKELKDLLRELAEIKSFWWSMYENFEAIERKYNDSDREKKQKVIDYLDNNFNSYVEKEQELSNAEECLNAAKKFTEFWEEKKLHNQSQQEYLGKIGLEISRMKEGSIALVNQVTTISKMRIFDPRNLKGVLSGISLSEENMEKINQKLQDLYVFK